MYQVTSMLCHHVVATWMYNSLICSTKNDMLTYMKERQMPWLALDFNSPLGEQLRLDFQCVSYYL